MTVRGRNTLSPFNAVSLALGLAFLYLPIVVLVIYSFNASRLVTVWGGWSLRWYIEFFGDRAMLEAALMSFRVAATSATIATLLGTHYHDGDMKTKPGIAVTELSGDGVWQYFNGSAWANSPPPRAV